jgi:hypothetical protein
LRRLESECVGRKGAKKVALEVLADTDEVPQGTVATGEKK